MSTIKRLKWLGAVRLDAFKACAKVLGRALDVPHCRSLDLLAQSCGWLSYRELTLDPDPRHGAGVPASGSLFDVYDLWCIQAIQSYGLQDRVALDAIELLPKLFRHLHVHLPSRHPEADEHAQDEEDQPGQVHDPMPQAGDRRDAEFREWLSGLVGRTNGQRRDSAGSPSETEVEELWRLQEELE